MSSQGASFFWRWLLCVSIIVGEIGVATAIPYAFKYILNLSPETHGVLVPFLLVVNYGILKAMRDILSSVNDIVFFPITNYIIRAVRLQVLMHVHRLSLEKRRALALSDVISAMRRVSQSTRTLLRIGVLQIIPSAGKFVAVSVFFVTMGLVVFPYLMGVSLVCVVLVKALPHYRRVRKKAWNASDTFVRDATDSLLQNEHTRTNLTFEMTRLANMADNEAAIWQATNTSSNLLQIALHVAKAIWFTSVLGTGMYLVLCGEISQGTFILIHGQLLVVLMPLSNLMRDGRQVTESMTDLEQVVRILSITSDGGSAISRISQDALVAVEGISFAYGKTQVLRGCRLRIAEGETYLIKGTNGSGKSTLVNIIAGVLSPTQGTVTYRSDTRLMYIPQDVSLYHGSLLFNVTLGDPQISLDTVHNALRDVGLEEFIGPQERLHALVGDLGMVLSGGQRARLWLARALVYKPNVLVLDETLDSIDQQARLALLGLLHRCVGTLVMTSHHPDVEAYTSNTMDLDKAHTEHLSQTPHPSREKAII
ncbi:MAG: ABC transporter ATP-binding protein [Alphaproteobacteria bacterium]|nr:MAG: ABC transporter ATP-binding protein [Alphaproteobacteria bacterium]